MTTPELDKVIDKIVKLLAMANDTSSPNEAMIAAKRARALMDKHDISVQDIEKTDGSQFLETEYDTGSRKAFKWMTQLAAAAGQMNDCVVLIRGREQVVVFAFQGFKGDAIVARLTLAYFVEACQRQCFASGAMGSSEKNFFRLGFSHALSLRVQALVAERTNTVVSTTGTALVPLKRQQVLAHFGQNGKPYRMPKTRGATEREFNAFQEGISMGQQLGLTQQIER